ncbi:50S ribosomal protein L25/general stress protein Ctc [Thiobacter aerophilum]|uniref:Large ribosomal subunit protein bL25 n=1 Tax=Thiobacter aerophilum TaxID=3121275 RepID=A0ABV0EGJ2_9BURK
MKFEVTATARKTQGTGASRRLRRAGRVPAIVYGGNEPPITIELDHNTVFHQLKHEAFHASILTLEVDGSKEQVLLRDVQMHPWKPLVLHLDFQRVDPNAKIHMKVPLHFVGADVAPGVKLAGGNITHVMNEAEVLCLPKDLPEFIEVDLSGLQAGHSLHLSEIKLPAGVEFVELRHGNDAAVASCVVPRGAAEEAAEGTQA